MKYSNEVIIHLPLEEVIQKFDNPENLKHWQPGLQSFNLIEGESGQPGAKSTLVYQMGKRSMEMVETIMIRDLPREFSATYETKGMVNFSRNFFEPIDDNTTRYSAENTFEASGIMKLLTFFAPGSFKKQTQKYMENFKRFAEDGSSVLNS